MINLLGFINDSAWDKMDAVQYYRCYLPLRDVDRYADDITAQVINREQVRGLTDDELGGRDLYVYPRVASGDCEAFVDEIHRRGGALVIDSDDDLTETYRLVSGRGEGFRKLLGLADYVTCSTPALATLFAQYTQKPPVVLRNCVDYDWMAATAGKAKRLIEGLTIGFSGSPTHWGDWYIPAVPFARIAREFESQDVVPLLHGETPRYLDHASPNILKFSGVPFVIYPVILAQFDILLCAVNPDDPFNSGKSAVKALEAMAIGVVPICSRFGPYIELADQGAPLVVVEEESRAGWYDAMRSLLEDEHKRQVMMIDGPVWVRDHRDMCRQGYKQWAEFYRSVT